jgi:hypothetical protein
MRERSERLGLERQNFILTKFDFRFENNFSLTPSTVAICVDGDDKFANYVIFQTATRNTRLICFASNGRNSITRRARDHRRLQQPLEPGEVNPI